MSSQKVGSRAFWRIELVHLKRAQAALRAKYRLSNDLSVVSPRRRRSHSSSIQVSYPSLLSIDVKSQLVSSIDVSKSNLLIFCAPTICMPEVSRPGVNFPLLKAQPVTRLAFNFVPHFPRECLWPGVTIFLNGVGQYRGS